MAQQPAPSSPSSLTLRFISAAVMLPVAFGAVGLGDRFFAVLVAVAAGLMYWEWQGLSGKKGPKANILALICASGPIILLYVGSKATLATWVLMSLSIFMLQRDGQRGFIAAGFAYIYLAVVGLAWIRGLDPAGMETCLWLLAAVMMTDTCAYFTGRTLGGPKLAPRISPNKTWSGLAGGIVGASTTGGILAAIVDADIVAVALVSGALAVVAQIGDLAVSKAKRAFGVKDSSNIIPGHGGMLDRFDGVLSASLAMALMSLAGGGSPLLWL